MRHFVADHRSDGAIVQSHVAVRIEERKLQDAGRKIDAVERRGVERIDRGRRHVPFGFVGGLADLVEVALPRSLRHLHAVAQVIVARNRHRAVVAPLLGVAHIVGDGGQFRQRGLPGIFRHPPQRLDILP